MQVVAYTTEKAGPLELTEVNSDEGPCLDCYATGEQLVNIDLTQVKTRWPRYRAATIATGFRSNHAFPLRLRNQVVGVLNLFCVDRVTLTAADVALGQALCDITTVGLLQERAVRHGDLLTDQLQSALTSRIVLEQAKGIVSERATISLDEAFALMRAHARRNHLQIGAVAKAIIDATITSPEFEPPLAATPGRADLV